MRAAQLLPLLTLSLLGCGATAGQDWLATPLPPTAPSVVARSQEQAASELETLPAPRPRLRHTITLGETYASSSGSYAGAASGAASVQVNTYVPVTVNNYGGYGYGGYGYGYVGGGGYRPPSHAPSSPPSQLQPGQDFPSPPSYGPSFPFRSAPASPWAR